jgi:hypothetical protein
MRTGLAASWAFIALNLICLFAGLWCTYQICRTTFELDQRDSMAVLVFSLLSYVFVKHATLPLSDMVYFGLSLAALALMSKAERSANRGAFLYASAAVVVLAILVRSIGATMVPAFFWACFAQHASGKNRRGRLEWWKGAIGFLFWTSAAILALLLTHVVQPAYFRLISDEYFRLVGSPVGYLQMWATILRILGEAALNIPLSKAPPGSSLAFAIAGAGTLALMIHAALGRAKIIKSVDIYVCAFVGVLVVHPWRDARLFLPAIPLVISWLFFVSKGISLPPLVLRCRQFYCSFYVILGLTALAYSTRLSIAGPHFATLYGDDSYRRVYQKAFGLGGGVNTSDVNEDVLSILRRYEPLAIQK